MDERQEATQKQNRNTTSTTAPSNNGTNSTQQTPDLNTLLDESPLPRPAVKWIKCLRAPAMSLSISMDKQHIPNYDASQGENESINSPVKGAQTGNSKGTSFTHNCTVRYFDLALGAVAVLLVGCLCKTCTGCKRAMKRWF